MQNNQHFITLPVYKRGLHLITQEVIKHIPALPQTGIMHIFIQHTSAALTINENADPTVRHDLNESLNRLAPEDEPYYEHTVEGPDDMPAHIKSVLVGSSVSIPITNGKLNLGQWQGIYLCEFRTHATPRKLIVTLLS